MAEYFVDTFFVIATFDPLDSAHRSMRRLEMTLRDQTLVTHDGATNDHHFTQAGFTILNA